MLQVFTGQCKFFIVAAPGRKSWTGRRLQWLDWELCQLGAAGFIGHPEKGGLIADLCHESFDLPDFVLRGSDSKDDLHQALFVEANAPSVVRIERPRLGHANLLLISPIRHFRAEEKLNQGSGLLTMEEEIKWRDIVHIVDDDGCRKEGPVFRHVKFKANASISVSIVRPKKGYVIILAEATYSCVCGFGLGLFSDVGSKFVRMVGKMSYERLKAITTVRSPCHNALCKGQDSIRTRLSNFHVGLYLQVVVEGLRVRKP